MAEEIMVNKLYVVDELDVKDGKIDYKDLIGNAETWVADLYSLIDEVECDKEGKKVTEDQKNTVRAAINLFSTFFGLEEKE